MDILNIILGAISNGIYALYPELDIFTEFVPEKLPKRCFLIGYAGEPTIKKDFGERYTVSGKIDIAYYVPKKAEELNAEFNRVFSNLSLELQSVEHEGVSIRLYNHERQIADDILHDICSFDTFLLRTDKTPKMKNVSIDSEEVR